MFSEPAFADGADFDGRVTAGAETYDAQHQRHDSRRDAQPTQRGHPLAVRCVAIVRGGGVPLFDVIAVFRREQPIAGVAAEPVAPVSVAAHADQQHAAAFTAFRTLFICRNASQI